MHPEPCRILALDGGGAKGFYTLGVLKEVEAMLDRPLYERFDLIFGTSTGAIIAALLSLGHSVDEIHSLYKKYVPTIMRCRTAGGRSKALAHLTSSVFGNKTFADVKTGVGIVATRWEFERPMIFKGSVTQAHGRYATFRAIHLTGLTTMCCGGVVNKLEVDRPMLTSQSIDSDIMGRLIFHADSGRVLGFVPMCLPAPCWVRSLPLHSSRRTNTR